MKTKRTTTRSQPLDVFSLVVGVLFSGFAAGALYLAFGGDYNPTVLKVALPVFLVALGVTGLLLSRRT